MRRDADRIALQGTIVGAGFESGDRFVVGVWDRGPLGPMVDVMWQRADERRVLLASSHGVAGFVAGLYRFEEVRVVEDYECATEPTKLVLAMPPVELELVAGARSPLFALRPKALRRWPPWIRLEDIVFRALVGRILKGAQNVRAYGVGPSGARQWYAIDEYRPMVEGSARVEGRDLGRLAPLDPPVTFGASAFPSRPAFVRCAPIIEDAPRFLPDPRSDPPGRERRKTSG